MGVVERVSALDTSIKEYLWRFTEGKDNAESHNRELLKALRESMDCGLAFVMTRNSVGDSISVAEVSFEAGDDKLKGVDFDVDSQDAQKLIQALDENSIGAEGLSFLGENFTNSVLYYAVVVLGELWGLVGVMDIRDQKRTWSSEEKESLSKVGKIFALQIENVHLKDALVRTENANKSKQQFLYDMSHDIRTPMNAIIGFATLAGSHLQEFERVQAYLDKITASSKHLLSLFNDVLDITRIEGGRVHLEELPQSLGDMMNDIKNVIQDQATAKEITFLMETAGVVHERIFCDRLRFNQVLLNLISNAVKYTDQGGKVTVTISEVPSEKEGYVSVDFEIVDNGIGMSPEFVAHIFEPFERENSAAGNVVQGTGLGMAITKNIIDLMGGDIVINSTQGEGTQVLLHLDLKLQSDVYVDGDVEQLTEVVGKKALIVIDSDDTCHSLMGILETLGSRVENTMSADEALQLAEQARDKGEAYDAYFVSWRIDDKVGGLEVVKQLRQLVGNDVPMFLITDGMYSGVEEAAYSSGVSAFIEKPLFLSDVKKTIKSAMNMHDADTEEHSIALEEFMGRRILLAEDNKMNQEIAITILEEAGFFVDLAENGEMAVTKVTNHPPKHYDVIIMDIKMPVMDGYEATRQIRSLEEEGKKDVPIIAMTADAFFEDRQAAFACGMNEHLAKPIDVERLFAVLKSVLD